jgi:hypothetical protein
MAATVRFYPRPSKLRCPAKPQPPRPSEGVNEYAPLERDSGDRAPTPAMDRFITGICGLSRVTAVGFSETMNLEGMKNVNKCQHQEVHTCSPLRHVSLTQRVRVCGDNCGWKSRAPLAVAPSEGETLTPIPESAPFSRNVSDVHRVR